MKSMNRSFDICPICKDFHWLNEPCKKQWKVRDPEIDEDWTIIHANNAIEAAEDFCKKEDQRGDYIYINQGGVEGIEVCDPQNGEIKIINITAETEPLYSGEER